jgi:hypothetical protein
MTPTSAIVGEPHLLAFVFRASVSLDVVVEVVGVEDGSKVELAMPFRAELSNAENAVYTVDYTPAQVGWYMAQYRAMSAGTNELVMTSTSRFRAEEVSTESGGDAGPTIVTRQVGEGGATTTSIHTSMMNMAGVLSFRTRSN